MIKQQDNLAIWSEVSKTNPAHTKEFSRVGGFRGTSINATYLAQKATEVFGPMGLGWGLDIEDEQIMQGAPIAEDCFEQIHKVRVKLWYKVGDQRGEVVQFGQTTFVGRNRNGLFTDEEAPKKSLTDAMTKCLSLLGFSADIFMGLYDDNKYVNDLTAEFAQKERKEERLLNVLKRISSADEEGLAKAQEWAANNIKEEADLARVANAIENRKARLAASGKDHDSKPKAASDSKEAVKKSSTKRKSSSSKSESKPAPKSKAKAETKTSSKAPRKGSAIAPILKRIEKADLDGLVKADEWARQNVKDEGDLKIVLDTIVHRVNLLQAQVAGSN